MKEKWEGMNDAVKGQGRAGADQAGFGWLVTPDFGNAVYEFDRSE